MRDKEKQLWDALILETPPAQAGEDVECQARYRCVHHMEKWKAVIRTHRRVPVMDGLKQSSNSAQGLSASQNSSECGPTPNCKPTSNSEALEVLFIVIPSHGLKSEFHR